MSVLWLCRIMMIFYNRQIWLIEGGDPYEKNMDVLRYLQRVPFFGDFSKKDLSEVANLKSNFMTFKKGNLIIKQGDIDLSFFVLIKGRASVRKKERPGTEIVVLEPGQLFGEMSYILQSNRTTNIVARTDRVTVLKLDADSLEGLSPAVLNKIKDNFLKLLAQRITEMDEQLSALKLEVEGVIQANNQVINELSNIIERITG